jgi:hypothetical protein
MTTHDLILITGLLGATPTYANQTDCVNCQAMVKYDTGLENILERHEEITEKKLQLFLKMSQDPTTANLYYNPFYSSGAESSMGLSWSPYEMRPQQFYGSSETYPKIFYNTEVNARENHFEYLPLFSDQDSHFTYPEIYPGVFSGSLNFFNLNSEPNLPNLNEIWL